MNYLNEPSNGAWLLIYFGDIKMNTINNAIKNEMYFHDEWDVINLQDHIDDMPEEADSLIDEFCHYDLPSDAVVGEEWGVPDWYIDGKDNPQAPYWRFSYPGFIAYIRSIKRTSDADILEVEYQLYRADYAHCSGYYCYWDKGTAMVNIATHRRWNVD